VEALEQGNLKLHLLQVHPPTHTLIHAAEDPDGRKWLQKISSSMFRFKPNTSSNYIPPSFVRGPEEQKFQNEAPFDTRVRNQIKGTPSHPFTLHTHNRNQ
jgi:hypothetical protein